MANKHEFAGKIVGQDKEKVYNKKSPYYGNTYYRLAVQLEKRTEPKEILVFENGLENKQIWTDLQAINYANKKYLFYCSSLVSNYRIVSYQLVNWKELSNSFSERAKQLDNHGSN